MKSLLLTAALLGVSVTSPVFAFTAKDQAAMPAKPTQLKPTVIVAPTDLPIGFSGATVNVEFTLDQAGRPHDISVPSVYDVQLKRQLVKAISQWQFVPRSEDGAKKRFVVLVEIKPQA